jgi:hypothetical protein
MGGCWGENPDPPGDHIGGWGGGRTICGRLGDRCAKITSMGSTLWQRAISGFRARWQ